MRVLKNLESINNNMIGMMFMIASQCGNARSTTSNTLFCMYLTHHLMNPLLFSVIGWKSSPSIYTCCLINGAQCYCWAIFSLLPFWNYLVQHSLSCILWPQFLSGWSPIWGNLSVYHMIPLFLHYWDIAVLQTGWVTAFQLTTLTIWPSTFFVKS